MAVITVYLRCNCVRIVHFLAKLREIMRCISIMQVLNALFILSCLSLIVFVQFVFLSLLLTHCAAFDKGRGSAV